MVLTADLEGIPVRVMIDLGAQGNFASERLGKRLWKQQNTKENLYRLTMADGSLTEYGDRWVRTKLK
jgi:hypothetical protein